LLSIALRSGATCELRAGTLAIGATMIPLATLRAASLVVDTTIPAAPGQPPVPAVALALTDGSSYVLTPVEQADATRLLKAIQAVRPDLALLQPAYTQPGPTPTGYAPGPGYPPPGSYAGGPAYSPPYAAPVYSGYGPGYPPPHPSGISDTDRMMAGIAHLSVFFAPLILPLIFWLAFRDSHPYASQQSKQAFWFHLGVGVIGAIVVVPLYFVFFFSFFTSMSSYTVDPTNPVAPAFPMASFALLFLFYGGVALLGLFEIIFSVIGAVNGFQGKPFHYPLLGRL
jgi:uncharacterized Tic20 family protein